MKRVTLRVPEKHISRIERLVDMDEYPNRSEAIRCYIKNGLRDDEAATTGRGYNPNPAD